MNKQELLQSKLKEEFESFKTSEKEISNEVIPQINQTTWSTEPIIHLELLKIERSRIPKGQVLKEEPSKKEFCTKTCFDDQEKPIYEETWEGHPSHGYKKYFIYSEDSLSTYKFTRDGTIEEIEFQEQQEGLPTLYGCHAENKVNTFDEYEYQSGRLSKINSICVYDSRSQHPTYIPKYDSFNNLSSLTRIDEPSDFFPKGQNIVVFERHKYSIKALQEILINEMIASIFQQIQAVKTKKVLVLAIENAFNSDDWLPPRYCFLDCDKVIQENQTIEEYIDFDQIEFNIHHETNEKILHASRLLEQEIELQEKYESPGQILFKMAKKLKSELAKFKVVTPPLIIPLDLPDDYQEDTCSVLERLYSTREIMKLTAC